MRPIRLHLDTSDFSVMYRASPGTMPAGVRDQLKEMARSGQIEIGLSYHVFFELMQKAEPDFRDDRLERARLLKELCGRNAFPYPTDLGQGRGFSTEGLWLPHTDLEDIEIERVVEHALQAMTRRPEVTRHELRVLTKRKYIRHWAISNLTRFRLLALEEWPLKFAAEFVESGDLERYLLEEMTRSEANRKLQFYITDPVTAYDIWFDRYGRDDPISKRRENIGNKIVLMLRELELSLSEAADLQASIINLLAGRGEDELTHEERNSLQRLKNDLKTFRREMTSPEELYNQVPRWKEIFGDQAALVASQILYAFHREKRPIKQSDGIDFVHAMYLPFCDLWRGDRAFSDLLIKHRVNFSERVVPTLADIPERIAAEISTLRNSCVAHNPC